MFKKFIKNIKSNFKNLDTKILKMMSCGLKICFFILIFSTTILSTYLFFIHNIFIYQLGILIFEFSLYLTASIIISGLAVDTIYKEIM